MAKETVAVVIKSKEAFEVVYTLPNTNKPTRVIWNKGNGFQTEVPTKITYTEIVGSQKITKVFSENYARHLLDAYGVKSPIAIKKGRAMLEFVKEIKRDDFIEEFPEAKETASEPVQETEQEKKTKGKKDEK